MLGFGAISEAPISAIQDEIIVVRMVADVGAFDIVGQPLEPLGTGSFTISWIMFFEMTNMATVTGSFALAGYDAAYVLRASIEAGAFAIAGMDAAFQVKLAAAAGSFSISWIMFFETTNMATDSGAFNMTGVDADLRRRLHTGISWSGAASVEYVSTTRFINSVERGDGQFALSAEIHLRSL